MSSAKSCEAHLLLARARVVPRHGDVHRVVEQVAQLDALVETVELGLGQVAVLEDHRHLELGGAQHAHRVLRLLLDEGELHVGIAAGEEGDRRRQERGAGGRERGQPDATAPHSAHRLELGLGGRQAGEHDLGMLDERLTGLGERHTAATAVHELRARLLLEGGDLLGDRRLRVREGLGGGGERAVLGDGLEHPQLLDIEHNESLSKPTHFRI